MASRPVAKSAVGATPGLTLTRRINAPAEKIYAAWTEPKNLIRWFGPASVTPGSLAADIDARVGGRYRISFDTSTGEHHDVSGVYREVQANRRLVFTWAWHSTPERQSLVTITLQPDGAGTLLTLQHAQFFDQDARDRHAKGWADLLGKLERLFN